MKNIDQIMTWGIVALCIVLVGVLFMSCATPESILRNSLLTTARHEARLKRIEADTLARPVQNQYSPGVLLDGWVPRYNNGYWYNGIYYNNSFYSNPYNRPLIRFNSNRYVVPSKRVTRRRTKTRRRNVKYHHNKSNSTRRVPVRSRRNNRPVQIKPSKKQ